MMSKRTQQHDGVRFRREVQNKFYEPGPVIKLRWTIVIFAIKEGDELHRQEKSESIGKSFQIEKLAVRDYDFQLIITEKYHQSLL